MITVRDQVSVEIAFADRSALTTWHAVVGGSMGGMRALEWAVEAPERVARLIVLAVGAASTAEQIAHSRLQIRAIKADPNFRGGDYYDGAAPTKAWRSLEDSVRSRIARPMSSRLDSLAPPKTTRNVLEGGQYAIESYLHYHGEKLAQRFDANSYVVLSEAMNHHDVGRGRGGVPAALGKIRSRPRCSALNRIVSIRSLARSARRAH